MNLPDIIAALDRRIRNPRLGLPEEVFLLVSRLTPLVNVDLLIRDSEERTLLTWREDAYYKAGWHIPGGIIRFKESAAERIRQVAAGELGAKVEFEPEPVAVNELFAPDRDERGHFISLLYRCRLTASLPEGLRYDGGGIPGHGQYAWFAEAPENLLEVHDIYRKYIC